MPSSKERGPSATASLSPMWTAAIVAVVLLAVLGGALASALTIRSLRPVGEGELLVADAQRAGVYLDTVAGEAGIDDLKRLRNELEIEAVSLVDAEGIIVRSTSATTPSGTPAHGLLARALQQHRFAAIAAPLDHPLSVDGIAEWQTGDVLYHAIQPLEDGGAVMLSYDVSEMLERRAEATRISPLVTPLAIGSGFLLLAAGLLHAARTRAAHVRREIELESRFLRARAEELELHNVELEAARSETQRALDLAEEKNRIRSEFVLMINHELRTPLTGVVTGARLLGMSPRLDEDDHAVLADVQSDGERLERLIAQMLAVARVENRGLAATPELQSLEGVVNRLDAARLDAALSVVDGVAVPSVDVITDVTTLVQLVASLVDNARTHGANNVEIVIADAFPKTPHHEVGRRPMNPIYVLVVDDGPGIDHDFLPRAFEKYEKRSFTSGTGLGLYLVRMMADSISASLSVITGRQGTVIAVGIPHVPALERTG